MEDWAEVRRLHRSEGMAITAISRKPRISRHAVRRALANGSPPVTPALKERMEHTRADA